MNTGWFVVWWIVWVLVATCDDILVDACSGWFFDMCWVSVYEYGDSFGYCCDRHGGSGHECDGVDPCLWLLVVGFQWAQSWWWLMVV